MIKLFTHYIPEDVIEEVGKTLRSGWTGLGPKVAEFEDKFAEYIGGDKYAVALNSGTAALEMAVQLIGIQPGDWVISTPMTFVATNHVLKKAGANIAFADIEPNGNINLTSVLRLLNRLSVKPKFMMVVHYGGYPIPLDELYGLADAHNIKVIEDCAHACGSTYGNYKIGGYPGTRYACFSFHSVKNLAVGDGGMLLVSGKTTCETAKKLRWFGIDKSTSDRTQTGYQWKYDVTLLGGKTHMNDIAATIGIGQLHYLDHYNTRRENLYRAYNHRLDDIEGVTIRNDFGKLSYHLMPIFLSDMKTRDRLMKYLSDNGVQTGVHYYPNHLYPMYRNTIQENGCKEAVKFYERELSLPMHMQLTMEDVEYICDLIKEYMKEGR